MAENPVYWGPATQIINDAIDNAHTLASEGYCGYSTAVQVAKALQEAGLLNEEDVWDADVGVL